MKMDNVTAKGVLLLMRPVPLAVWSIPTILLGFVVVQHPASNWDWALFWAIIGALVLQGLVTHGLNDLYDWQSGTDQTSPGMISGGSKVLNLHLLSMREIWFLVGAGVIIYGGAAVALASIRGWEVLVWAATGLTGSVLYSLPPMRLSYRPLLGEWVALFPAMVSGVIMGALAASSQWTGGAVWASLWYGTFCVASVMQHHFSDISADWASTPQKRTTPAYWLMGRGRSPQEPVLCYEVLALTIALAASVFCSMLFVPTVGASFAAIAMTGSTRLDGGIGHLTRMDLGIKALVPLTLIAVMLVKLLVAVRIR
ncbi:MAG: hypothetical protein C7B45_16290 [Sulfobacillus acidophilus]|uniref:Prenyltransferase n=1 Tax=Sulfobacillus acidophilus TaxID=53633 RepID=A0A2T2WD34_9FIRM|nr:MAG: hypothetical protein C7B45_16290 [Sulfobacillus acidophilus]